MGPPQRPAGDERQGNYNDFADVLIGSGIDEKEEEAALTRQRTNGISFASDVSASFHSGALRPDYFGGRSGFTSFSRNVPGDESTFFGGGTLNQPAAPLDDAAREANEQHRRTVRRQKAIQQYHMADPFLFGAVLLKRINARATNLQVRIPNENALRRPTPPASLRGHPPHLISRGPENPQVIVHGPDNHEQLVVLQGRDVLLSQSPMVELCTLLSLAAEERIRSIMEDAATLAKGRRKGAHGIVPVDLLDLAVGNGKPEDVVVRPTSSGSSRKREPCASLCFPDRPLITLIGSFTALDADEPLLPDPPKPQNTIAFPNTFIKVFSTSADAEIKREDSRAAKRRARAASTMLTNAEATAAALTGGGPPPVPSGPGTPAGERAPDLDTAPRKPMSKKEQKRVADARVAEAQSYATATAASMALGGGGPSWLSGGGGSKKGQPAWLTSKASPAVAAGLGPRGPAGGAAVEAGTSRRGSGFGLAGAGMGREDALGMGKGFGSFREDLEGGKGVLLRDVMAVLEPEAMEQRAVLRLITKLNKQRE